MQYLNNFTTVLDADLPSGATGMTLPLAEAGKMSTATPASPYRLTLSRNGTEQVEVVDVTDVTGAICTIARAVEDIDGVAAVQYNWFTLDIVECRPTVASITLLNALASLNDVDLTGIADGYQLHYNALASAWEVAAPSAGAMGSLTDVDLTGLADGYQLHYDTATSTWVVAAPAAGGSGGGYSGDQGTVTNLGTYDSGTRTVAVATDADSNFRLQVSDTSGTVSTCNLNLANPGTGTNLYVCVLRIEDGWYGDMPTGDSCVINIRNASGDASAVVARNNGAVSIVLLPKSWTNGAVVTLYTTNNGANWYADI